MAETPPDFVCTLCGARAADAITLAHSRTVSRCRACGVAHWLPRPSAERRAEAQLEDVAEYEDRLAALAPGFAREHDRLLRRLARHLAPPARLLEVGCTSGRFLLAAQRRGYEVTGLEPAAAAAEVADPAVRQRIRAETLEETELGDEAFDVIVLIQVVEHFLDPVGALRIVARLLRPGGVLYLETPNFDSVSRRLDRPGWVAGNVGPGHWHLFHGASLRRLCEEAGLEVAEEWTYFKALSVSSPGRSLAVRALNRAARRSTLGNNLALVARRA
jgi:SAM-dependent methyltransferase